MTPEVMPSTTGLHPDMQLVWVYLASVCQSGLHLLLGSGARVAGTVGLLSFSSGKIVSRMLGAQRRGSIFRHTRLLVVCGKGWKHLQLQWCSAPAASHRLALPSLECMALLAGSFYERVSVKSYIARLVWTSLCNLQLLHPPPSISCQDYRHALPCLVGIEPMALWQAGPLLTKVQPQPLLVVVLNIYLDGKLQSNNLL